jgi:small subunit ribosomal protein S2
MQLHDCERRVDDAGCYRHLNDLPNLMFIVDVHREVTAIHEANLLDIPVIALVDTNCDPEKIDYPIAGNDDAIRSIRVILQKLVDAIVEGQGVRGKTETASELAAVSE